MRTPPHPRRGPAGPPASTSPDPSGSDPSFPGLSGLPEEWARLMAAWGEPAFRAKQIFRSIHHRGVMDPAAMTDLSRPLRARLHEAGLGAPMSLADVQRAGDGTRKLLLRLPDRRDVETVLIPMGETNEASEPAESKRAAGHRPVTQCVSSQVGCAMGCVFCASGLAGLKRHMSADEIVAQVLFGRQHVQDGERIGNVVFMGMGEPLANYDAVARALSILFHPLGMGLSKRRVTVSTSGLIPQIDQLGRDFGGDVQLAISLHAPDDQQRSEIMPINRKYPLPELMACLERYPLPKRRRITIEYTLIAGFNDGQRDADRLARLLRRVPTKVNLIPLNAVPGTPLSAPTAERVDAFQARLRERKVAAFVRRRMGDDIAAACGQLALPGEARKVRVRLPVTAAGVDGAERAKTA